MTKKKIIPQKKDKKRAENFLWSFSRKKIKLRKNAVIFCEIVFIGVQVYSRECFRKKHAKARESRCFPCLFFNFTRTVEDACPYNLTYTIFLLAVEQVFSILMVDVETVSHYLLRLCKNNKCIFVNLQNFLLKCGRLLILHCTEKKLFLIICEASFSVYHSYSSWG